VSWLASYRGTGRNRDESAIGTSFFLFFAFFCVPLWLVGARFYFGHVSHLNLPFSFLFAPLSSLLLDRTVPLVLTSSPPPCREIVERDTVPDHLRFFQPRHRLPFIFLFNHLPTQNSSPKTPNHNDITAAVRALIVLRLRVWLFIFLLTPIPTATERRWRL